MIGEILNFVKATVLKTGRSGVLIAVSGGIDSSVSLTLATRALGADRVHTLLLPFVDQDMSDAREVIVFNQISEANQYEINIEPVVAAVMAAKRVNQVGSVLPSDAEPMLRIRTGNVMARSRMMLLFDLAKQLDLLVCGTENKSEKYLGYFTRYGDEASDLEPIQHLWKTQVRQIANDLDLPKHIIDKPPSAELWQEQTDEAELGFRYEVADQVLTLIVDTQPALLERLTNGKARSLEEVRDGVRFLSGAKLELAEIEKVLTRVQKNWFKHQVPYVYEGNT